MGHRQKMTDKERVAWDAMQYRKRLESMRGHHYPYWSCEKFGDWQAGPSTKSEIIAKQWRDEMKQKYKKVRIVCGYEQWVQRVRVFTIMYKP